MATKKSADAAEVSIMAMDGSEPAALAEEPGQEVPEGTEGSPAEGPVLPELDTNQVTVGQPVEGGCVWTCFTEKPQVPTDAVTKMPTLGYESLGELSENGFTEGKSATSNKFKGWHGDVLLSNVSDEENTFKLEFVEPNRPSVAKLRYGADNVDTGKDGSVAHIRAAIGSGVTVPLVIDELESNGYLRRTVVPKASIDSFDDVPHQRGNLLVYGMTFTAIADGGSAFDIYRAKPAKVTA